MDIELLQAFLNKTRPTGKLSPPPRLYWIRGLTLPKSNIVINTRLWIIQTQSVLYLLVYEWWKLEIR